jgi:hypothetical protein
LIVAPPRTLLSGPESQQQRTEHDEGKRKTHRLPSGLHQRCERAEPKTPNDSLDLDQ